ncbi:hypothetical protein T492DRAFT_993949 [Pavlovales sp. CCMP2436]|nr:hypothetical protein T492DRAFT_993949 [Pavlovales sp. CCMP2436]
MHPSTVQNYNDNILCPAWAPAPASALSRRVEGHGDGRRLRGRHSGKLAQDTFGPSAEPCQLRLPLLQNASTYDAAHQDTGHGRRFCPPATYAARQTRPRPVSWRPITSAPNGLRRTHTRGERWLTARPRRQGRWVIAARADRLASDKRRPLVDAGRAASSMGAAVHSGTQQRARQLRARSSSVAAQSAAPSRDEGACTTLRAIIKGGGGCCSARRFLPRAATQASFADAGLAQYVKTHGY